MVYLMITHKMQQGKNVELREAIAQCVRIWERQGCKVLGVWTNWIGGGDDKIMYIYQFKDFAEYEEIDVKAHNDPEWPDYVSKLDATTIDRTTELLRPTEYSPV